jgi:hypothetical protein
MSKESSILHRTLIFPLDGAGGELIFRTLSDGNAGSEEFALNIGSAEKSLHGSKKASLWLLRGGENDEIGFFQWSQHLMSTWYL